MASDALEKARKVAAIYKQIKAQIHEQVASHL
jgi:DNA-binding transcriptional regulator YhcF (GntR family)